MRFLLLTAAVFVPAFAHAQDEPQRSCINDGDCAADERCELLDCGPTCDPDAPDCEPIDCGSGGVCVSTTPVEPIPECASDVDCTGDDICITETFESCSGGGCACADDGDGNPDNDAPCDCPEEQPIECESESYSFCGPRYLDGCDVDADCGAGFTCEAVADCSCASSPDDGSDDGSDDAAEDCACAPSDERSCVLVRVECTDDADCGAGFTCVDEASDVPCSIDSNGDASCEVRETDGARICAPEGFEGGVAVEKDTAASNADDDGDGEDDGDNDGDDDDGLDCSQSNGPAGLSFSALALVALLARRRR